MASRLDDQLLKLRLRLLQEKLSSLEREDTARSRSRTPSNNDSSALRVLLENAQRRRNDLERRLQEERLARTLARPPPAPQYMPVMLPPIESKKSPDYMELMMMQNAQLNQLVTSQLMLSLMRPQQQQQQQLPPPRTPSPRRSPRFAPSMPLVPPLRGLEDASTSRLMAYFEKEYRAAGALSERPAHAFARGPLSHPLATGRRPAYRGRLRVDPGQNKRFSDHIEHVD